MLGHKLCQKLAGHGHSVVGAIRKDPSSLGGFAEVFSGVELMGGVDVLDDNALLSAFDKARPDFVVNAVGIVKQLEAANNAYLSVAINSLLPHRLAILCAEKNARLFHISTDCVFDGERGGYTETDFSDARDLYGKSKFLGETDDTETAAITLRTSIIGRELHRPTHGLLEWFLSQAGKTTKGFADAIYTGFPTGELAEVIAMLIRDHPGLHGLYQVASNPINKYDLLRLIKDIYGLDVQIDRDDAFHCDRSMKMQSFTDVTGYTAPTWEQLIRQMHEDATPYDSWFATA